MGGACCSMNPFDSLILEEFCQKSGWQQSKAIELFQFFLKNHYQIKAFLGKCIFSFYFLAHSVKFNSFVEVKVSIINFSVFNKIQNEFYVVQQIQGNKYLSNILDIKYDKNLKIYFFSTQLYHTSLREINKKFKFTDEMLYALAYQLFSGLVELEKQGIIHGNIRPENIRYNAEKNEFITIGFDVSAQIENSIKGQNFITPEAGKLSKKYLAPESIFLKPPYDKVDVYSLGVTFVELLVEDKDKKFYISTLEEVFKDQQETLKHPFVTEILTHMMQIEESERKPFTELLNILKEKFNPDEKHLSVIAERYKQKNLLNIDQTNSIVYQSSIDKLKKYYQRWILMKDQEK